MEPALFEGDVVVAVRRLLPPRPLDLVIAEIGGRRVVKRVAEYDPAAKRCLLGVENPYGWVDLGAIPFRVIFHLNLGATRTARSM